MQQFFENNWLSIVSILIGILVSYIFYRLQKKDAASAVAERKKHATRELLDVVESYIINKQQLSERVIENLIHASERDHQVVLRPPCTAISLLQDVALRLQRSRHLDIPQKSEYSEKIEQLIRDAQGHRIPIHAEKINDELSSKLQVLQKLVPEERKAEFQDTLTELESLIQRQADASLLMEKTKQRMVAVTTSLLGVTAAVATALIGSQMFSSFGDSEVSSAFSKLFPVMGAGLAVIVATEALTTILRIKRRNRDPASKDDKHRS